MLKGKTDNLNRYLNLYRGSKDFLKMLVWVKRGKVWVYVFLFLMSRIAAAIIMMIMAISMM